MARCHGFSTSLLSGVSKARFPGLGDTGFPLAVAASLAGLVLPETIMGALLPTPVQHILLCFPETSLIKLGVSKAAAV